MALLSVKVFDKDNVEIHSTVSILTENFIHEFIPHLGELARDQSAQDHIQALIRNHHLIAFYNTPEDLLLVAFATLNTSFHRLHSFLEHLGDTLRLDFTLNKSKPSSQDFQDTCDSIAKKVDSSTEMKIALLGLDRSGKTTFANYFSEDKYLAVFDSYVPTNLLNIVKVPPANNLPSMQFYDLGMAFQNHWWKFSKESDAFIFFISSDDTRMNEARGLLQEIRNFWDLPFVIAANKKDASKIVNLRKYVSRKLRVPIKLIFETETSTGIGLVELLQGLVKEIQNKNYILNKLSYPRKK
ncbi:MAG: ADP-ribosylation factor-like protein [Candidatus Hodarchaeales archaeon]